MNKTTSGRRTFLNAFMKLGAGSLAFSPLVAGAGPLLGTVDQTKGPFYPDDIPLDSDNDLVWVDGRERPAQGIHTNVVGRVVTPRGKPIVGAKVEIWQCDARGGYHHPDDPNDVPRDDNFQGYGSTVTDADGRYRFRTIKPVAYPGRVPHIHYQVTTPEGSRLATQLYFAGYPGLEQDGVFRRIEGEARRQGVQAEFRPNPDDSAELLAEWDVVIA
jgi:protocatechuate 3,4-dioxygenase beta subunit